MSIRTHTRHLLACMLVLTFCISSDQTHANADIPAKEITALQEDFAEISSQSSAAKKRRSCKSIIRKGNGLIEDAPTAPNRFEVLAIMLQSQKLLLSLDNSEDNRKSLFEICGELAKAPNTYATLRLDADLLYSNMTLDQKNASKEERAKALTDLIARYRDTSVEAKCLMIASMIARAIESQTLENEIITLMTERFPSDADVVQFRLKNLGFGRADIPFTGTFKRNDSTSFSFPVDQLGHTSVVVFWSKQMPGFQDELKIINEKISPYSSRVQVFSFNMDELSDAGEKQLRDLGLNWMAMHLPDGKNSRLARIFGTNRPYGYLVNAYGHTLLMTDGAKRDLHGNTEKSQSEILVSDQLVAHPRIAAQLQSLFIGDFLALNNTNNPKPSPGSIPQEKINAIRSCFTQAPMRYRLTPEQALAGYTKAEALCRETISQFPNAPDLWQIRNLRIIALLGMWKTSMEPKHFAAAVAEANTALTTKPPKNAQIIPHFCLTKAALRQEKNKTESILADFIKATEEEDTPASAYASAALLALEAHSRSQHKHYREKFLAAHDEKNAALWPVAAFLRDRYYQFNLLHATDQRRERRDSRSNIVDHRWNSSSRPFPAATLKTLDGKPITLPKDSKSKLTLLLFVELPPEDEPPVNIFGKPAEGKRRASSGAVNYAWQRASEHIHQDVNMLVAFLNEDTDRIKALAKERDWKFQMATVPDGINNPTVQQLGVISADQIANIFLIRRDGTIAWQTTGLKHQFSFSHEFSAYLGLTVHIELCDIALAYQALEQGDYEKAAKVFAGPFPKKKDERFGWTAPRFHGRALANMKLKQWDAALTDIDQAIAAHNPKSFRHDPNRPSDALRELHAIRATILTNLGKKEEAQASHKIATTEHTPYPGNIYLDFHEKLKALR